MNIYLPTYRADDLGYELKLKGNVKWLKSITLKRRTRVVEKIQFSVYSSMLNIQFSIRKLILFLFHKF